MNKTLFSLYKQRLFGIKALTPVEQKTTHPEDLRSIDYDAQRTQEILNDWKQELLTAKVNEIFFTMFPKAPKTETLDILVAPAKTHDFKVRVSFKDLGVNQQQIIDKLIKKSLLPNI